MTSLIEQQNAFALDFAKLLIFIDKQTLYCSIGEVYRTQEQADIYAKQCKGIPDSLHCKKLAVDINLFNRKDLKYIQYPSYYQPLGDYWESLSPQNRWGGYFVSKYGGKIVDLDHFERKQL